MSAAKGASGDQWPAAVLLLPLSALDEGSEPSQSLVPLLRHGIEVGPDFLDRSWREGEPILTARANAMHYAGPLEHSKMLGDRLPGELRALG